MKRVCSLAWVGCGGCVFVALLVGFAGVEHSGQTTDDQKGTSRMTNQLEHLPFQLDLSDLPKVGILYGFYSAKTGAGKQEITISGDGTVKLFLTRSMYDAKPEVRQGKVSSEVILRLLDVIEGENFFALEDHYPPTHDPHARRILRFTLPDREKTIILDEPRCPEFERVAGAVKLTAGLALPEALNRRFFPNL